MCLKYKLRVGNSQSGLYPRFKHRKKIEEMADTQPKRVHLKRRIKLYQAVAMIFGPVVGSAIYITPGNVLKGSGSPIAAVVLWIVAGILSLFGALSYAELATTYPGSGENMHYLNKFYGPLLSFNYTWMYLLFLRPAANAVKAITFGKYFLQMLYPACTIPDTAVKLLAIILAMASAALNTVNVEAANKTHSLVTSLTALALLSFSVIGIVHLGQGKIDSWNSGSFKTSYDAGSIVLTLYVALYAYGGWNILNFMVEEVKKPEKNAPRAIVIGMTAVVVLYVMVNVAYITILGSSDMINSEAVAVTFGQRVFPSVAWLVPVIVCISQMSSYNGANVAGTRLLFSSAREGYFPSSLTLITTWSRSPVATLIFQTMITFVYIMIYDIYGLIRNIMFVMTLYNLLVLVGLIRDRYKRPDIPRPLKNPIAIPLLYLLMDVLLLVVPLATKPLNAAIGAIFTLGTGIPVYMLFVSARWRNRQLNKIHRVITCFVQKVFLCLPEEAHKN